MEEPKFTRAQLIPGVKAKASKLYLETHLEYLATKDTVFTITAVDEYTRIGFIDKQGHENSIVLSDPIAGLVPYTAPILSSEQKSNLDELMKGFPNG
jgi:hypothetical protein